MAKRTASPTITPTTEQFNAEFAPVATPTITPAVHVFTVPMKAGSQAARTVHASTTLGSDTWAVISDASEDFMGAYSATMSKLEREASNKQAVANVEYAARRAAAKAAIASMAD